MPRAVTMIPATINRFTALSTTSVTRRKVAGYARVSTDSEEQQTSYEAQVDYYTHYIQSREDWEFVGVYTDEGISATNTKHRDGFKKMVKDALAGKIDLIVTKSVSRFARNTVDSLTTVRKLKEHGTEIYFEKENIFTFDSKGELLITIMSSLAQEESRSISENVTWGQRKRFADGKVSMPYKQFLGYEKGEDGMPVVNEEEAAIVRLIYRLFLEGKTPAGICRYLEQQGIPTPSGKQKWSQTTVDSILSNEKYKGDALLQKKFTVDFLMKKMKTNEGEVPQYYVEHSHEAIIVPLEWDMVQAEIARRRSLGRAYSGNSVFSSKLVCGDCGGFFGQKVWHSNDPYRKVIWRCNSKFKGETKCATPHLDTETIQRKFLIAYNRLMADREGVISDCALMRRVLSDTTALDAELDNLNEEITVVSELVKTCVKENASTAQSQEEYAKKYNGLLARYEKATARLTEVTAEKEHKHDQDRELRLFIEELKKQPLVLEEWDERLWISILDRATVFRDGRIAFKFKSSREIEVER
ncbi:MAG: recombinase family protein [Negativicutes bacterium]|uniref:recombinase family protein n=1 Tax=Dehalococcoides mccartyi TaxID=61435 RepID=UPI000CDF2B69|nr:recombinase family protein [Dehalococcoides mccartyi]MCE5197072.1 recombinase family protein [Negativicutes bacterium]POZ59240.1 Phage integrase (Site-specific recombinase) [Dehalococcoides mccartyi]